MARDCMRIIGGTALSGEVSVSGGKNTSVAAIPATLLADGPCVLENIPDIDDVHALIDILRSLGAQVSFDADRNVMKVDPTTVNTCVVSRENAQRLRASYYLMGALLGRLGEAEVPLPGGCPIGPRPIDQHLKAFRALGAEVDDEGGVVHMKAPELMGSLISFDIVTVGGTINAILAAAKAEGVTLIQNAAREPHVVDVANLINSMGGKVRGAGTAMIRITGQRHLRGTNYAVIPDQIETGTMMIAAAATHGDVTIHNCIPVHMESLTAKLLEVGVRVSAEDDVIRVWDNPRQAHRAVKVTTQAYPGFPTDLQQPFSALLTTASGVSKIEETIFEQRFRHLDELVRMGARVDVRDSVASIEGVPRLIGTSVTVTDLRAGAGLLVAGLMAEGETVILEPHFIDCGYDHVVEKLSGLGARISREVLE